MQYSNYSVYMASEYGEFDRYIDLFLLLYKNTKF